MTIDFEKFEKLTITDLQALYEHARKKYEFFKGQPMAKDIEGYYSNVMCHTDDAIGKRLYAIIPNPDMDENLMFEKMKIMNPLR